jgi:hypothetical protein
MHKTTYAKSKELSTGFPRPLPIPQAHRNTAQVIVTPISVASTLLISGKVVIRQRKYTELDMIEADNTSNPIYMVQLVMHISKRKLRDTCHP